MSGSHSTTGPETVRVDQWLRAVRLTKTRSNAAAACRAGHVKVNGTTAKPATSVRIGDTIHAHLAGRSRVVEVTELLTKRVGAALAADTFVDHSPPPPPREELIAIPRRDPGTGRPTKRDRRQLDRARGRS